MDDQPGTSLSSLVGSQLIGVAFVLDYVTLSFEPLLDEAPPGVLDQPWKSGISAQIHLWSWPALEADGRQMSLGAAGYRDQIVEQIGRLVTQADEEDEQLRLVFEGGVMVVVPLRVEDLVETAMLYINKPTVDIIVWRPGDLTPT